MQEAGTSPRRPTARCRVCGRTLQVIENYSGDGALIGLVVEHAVAIPGTPEHDPVPEWMDGMGDSVSVCDFCAAPGPVWMYPSQNYTMKISPHEEYLDDGEWYACQSCYEDIEADRWQAVVQRCVDRIAPPSHQRKEAVDQIDGYLREFIRSRSGPPARIHASAR